MNGTKVELRTSDGVAEGYVARPDGPGPWPGALFFMDGLGPRPALYEMADRLAASGYYVLLPDMYYRFRPFAPFDVATVFNGGPEMERLIALVTRLTEADSMRDTGAFLDFLSAQPGVRPGKVACFGYCLGGGLAVCAASHFPDRFALAASFHGGRFLVEDTMPQKLASTAKAMIYIGVAEIDRRHTPEVSRHLDEALTSAGVPHEIELYPGASHGFAVGDAPVYNRPAAEHHWGKLLGLLRATLGA